RNGRSQEIRYTINLNRKIRVPIYNRANWWLRAVASSSNFANANNNGNANANGASNANGVRPIMKTCTIGQRSRSMSEIRRAGPIPKRRNIWAGCCRTRPMQLRTRLVFKNE
ncbi:MAG: DUF6273 domain-containing protein, partial [Lachnospiraceae bacterium]|nr:DUF6273 domain-containing protein [Lachnospiraceae bacterium]